MALGTGIGAALLLDGELYRGAFGVAPELGHIRVVPDGRPCPCGKRGCWERYCSGTALATTAVELLARDPGRSPVLARLAAEDPGRITGRRVAGAARDGDPVACAAMAELARWLGEGLALIADVFDPELVVIGGGVSESAPLFLDEAREHYAARLTGRRLPPAGPDPHRAARRGGCGRRRRRSWPAEPHRRCRRARSGRRRRRAVRRGRRGRRARAAAPASRARRPGRAARAGARRRSETPSHPGAISSSSPSPSSEPDHGRRADRRQRRRLRRHEVLEASARARTAGAAAGRPRGAANGGCAAARRVGGRRPARPGPRPPGATGDDRLELVGGGRPARWARRDRGSPGLPRHSSAAGTPS